MGYLRAQNIVAASLLLLLLQMVTAANITVGGPNGGWDQATDLQSWASSRTFKAGDKLIFQYSQLHNVLEVKKSDYDSCRGSSPLKTHNDGSTVISLTSPGKRYFICGTPGHCSQGMKLEVDIVAAAPAPAPAITPSPSPSRASPSGTSSPASPQSPALAPSQLSTNTGSPPPPSAADRACSPLKMAAGLGLGMAMLMA